VTPTPAATSGTPTPGGGAPVTPTVIAGST
jgi:hypothetical protein